MAYKNILGAVNREGRCVSQSHNPSSSKHHLSCRLARLGGNHEEGAGGRGGRGERQSERGEGKRVVGREPEMQ
jgi:hypothetical protein